MSIFKQRNDQMLPLPELPPPPSRKAEANIAWDYWWENIPADLRSRLSAYDLKRLGDLLVKAFTQPK